MRCLVAPAHAPHPQPNFASRDACRRSACRASRAEGLAYDEVRQLVGRAAYEAPAMPGTAEPAAAPASAVVAGATDVELTCRDCSSAFAFGVQEQAFYEERRFAPPTRCADCRAQKRRRLALTTE